MITFTNTDAQDLRLEDLDNSRRELDTTNPKFPDSTYLGDDLYIQDVGDGWFEFHDRDGRPQLTLKSDVAQSLKSFLTQNVKASPAVRIS